MNTRKITYATSLMLIDTWKNQNIEFIVLDDNNNSWSYMGKNRIRNLPKLSPEESQAYFASQLSMGIIYPIPEPIPYKKGGYLVINEENKIFFTYGKSKEFIIHLPNILDRSILEATKIVDDFHKEIMRIIYENYAEVEKEVDAELVDGKIDYKNHANEIKKRLVQRNWSSSFVISECWISYEIVVRRHKDLILKLADSDESYELASFIDIEEWLKDPISNPLPI